MVFENLSCDRSPASSVVSSCVSPIVSAAHPLTHCLGPYSIPSASTDSFFKPSFYLSFPSSPSVATSSLIQIPTLVSLCVPCLGLDYSAATLTTWPPHTNPYYWSSTRLALRCSCLFDLQLISTPASDSLLPRFRQITREKIEPFPILRIRSTTLIYNTSTIVTWARHCFPVRPNNLANPKVHPQANT